MKSYGAIDLRLWCFTGKITINIKYAHATYMSLSFFYASSDLAGWQGCYIDLTFLNGSLLLEHTCLKCNIVNFEIPNRFLYYGNEFGIPKLTRLHFKWACSRSRLPFKKVRSMQQQTWYSYLFIFIYYIEKSTNANIDIYWSIILFYCQTSTKFIGKKPSHFDQIPLLWKMKKHSSAWWRKLCVS